MRILIAIVLLLLLGGEATAQQLDLQAERRAAEAQIARIAAELKGVNSSQLSTTKRLRLIRSRIAQRNKVVSNIEAQIALLVERETSQNGLVSMQSERLATLLGSFRHSITVLYNTYLTSGLRSLLLSSTTREQLIRRGYFARIFIAAIENQACTIERAQRELGVELAAITAQKQELSALRAASAAELQLIVNERRQAEQLSASLGKNASELIAQQAAKRRALDALQREIERAVSSEMSVSNTKTAPLSGEFSAARGRLICPLSGARVVDTYGVHPHPSEKGVKVDNRGINLQSSRGGAVRAVFEGEVRRVFMVPGMGRSVLVRHGEFLTVYSSLESASVVSGQKISGGQTVGTMAGEGVLHFEIWRENQTLNPALWINF